MPSEHETSFGQDSGPALSNAKLLRGRHVFLIEDDREAREAIEAQLNEWGVICLSGVDAGEVLAKSVADNLGPVDWIIADFRLPGLRNGVDVIAEVRRVLGYNPPAILVSAEVDRERLSALLPSSTRYLQKPFEARSLMNAMLVDPSKN
jgi:DNA-binding response OmpR family regulator